MTLQKVFSTRFNSHYSLTQVPATEEGVPVILRLLIFLHRWVGIALCLLFLLWFPSGIGMMYWTFPAVSNNDRLDHSPKLNPSKIMLSPTEAAGKVGMQEISPDEIRLNTF